jgi:uncharacterized protein
VSTPNNAPTFRLSLDGRDITPTVEARLVSLQLEEARGDTADQLDITLSDHDGKLQIPSKGVTIALAIGWVGSPLVDKGTFVVDEAEHSGSPDQITIRARSAELGESLRTRRDQSWHDLTVGDILGTIAKRNNLTLRIDTALAAKALAHIDQTNESDINFLSRLGQRYDAVATVKKGKLIFLPINGTKTSAGKRLPTITITRQSGDSHSYTQCDRDSYTGVEAYWHDGKKANRTGVTVGTKVHLRTLKETYASAAEARQAAQAEWQRIQRGAATLSITLALGNPSLVPQSTVEVIGFKDQIDGTEWLVAKSIHTFNDSGFVTRAEMETGAE